MINFVQHIAKCHPHEEAKEEADGCNAGCPTTDPDVCSGGERCAFVGAGGVRCQETKYLELHHTVPWALYRRSSPEILSVRCRAHNQYEAAVDFGERAVPPTRSKAGPSLIAGP